MQHILEGLAQSISPAIILTHFIHKETETYSRGRSQAKVVAKGRCKARTLSPICQIISP
jgi:hypothetical protein